MIAPGDVVSVSRCHGLGNVLQLLPVLRTLGLDGRDVELVTRTEWACAVARLAPEIRVVTTRRAETLDLDAYTLHLRSTRNRTDEFMELLGVKALRPFDTVVPDEWLAPWGHVQGAIVFAPEAAHQSRQCPPALAVGIGTLLRDEFLVVVGRDPSPPVPCRLDLRGQTTLEDMIAIVALAARVICMDSGVLHAATLLGTPAVAVFGGITPESRTRQDQHLVVLAGDVPCRPCDKHETCAGAYHCLARIKPADVVASSALLHQISSRRIRTV